MSTFERRSAPRRTLDARLLLKALSGPQAGAAGAPAVSPTAPVGAFFPPQCRELLSILDAPWPGDEADPLARVLRERIDALTRLTLLVQAPLEDGWPCLSVSSSGVGFRTATPYKVGSNWAAALRLGESGDYFFVTTTIAYCEPDRRSRFRVGARFAEGIGDQPRLAASLEGPVSSPPEAPSLSFEQSA